MTSSMGGYSGLRGPTGQIGNKVPSGYRSGQMAQFTPEQMQLFQQMFSQVSPDSFLSKLAGGDQQTFNQVEAPALRQFSELQGGLASRFSGIGGEKSLGSRKSSGFQNTASAQASNFAQELQSQRQALQRQAIMDLMGLSENLLNQRPYENYILPKQQKKPGFLESMFSSAPKETLGTLGKTAQGAIGGAMYGGPYGALVGGLGGLASSFF